MNRLITFALAFLLLAVLSQRFSWFVPEVAVAATCEETGPFESGKNQLHLIELYTSEGCSSCPPAEKWLNSLYKDPNLYKTFVPVAFHVDYWNYLGHPDPLSKPGFSNRQRRYASEWSSRTVYTPGFVQDGEEWRSLMRKAPTSKGEEVGNLKVKPLEDNQFEVSFNGKGKSGERVFGVYLLHGLEHKIKRGENRGKILKHNFVVGDLAVKNLEKGKAILRLKKPDFPHKDQSVAFWVSSKNSLKPIQAVGRCLK